MRPILSCTAFLCLLSPALAQRSPIVRVHAAETRPARADRAPSRPSNAFTATICSTSLVTGYGEPTADGPLLTFAHANAGTRSSLAGTAFFSQTGGTDRNQGVFVADAQGIHPIAVGCGGGGGSGNPGAGVGDPSPLGGTFSGFFGGTVFAPASNAGGDVLFVADVDGGSSPRGLFLYQASTQTIAKVAAVGDASPAGGTLIEVGPGSMNDARTVVFAARGSTATNDLILKWEAGVLTKVAANGDPAPSVGSFDLLITESFGFADGSTIHVGPLPDVNNAGRIAFRAITNLGERGIVVQTGGVNAWYVRAGEATPHGGTYLDMQGACLNDAGQVAFFADWKPTPTTFNSGWFVGMPGDWRSALSFFDPIGTGMCFGLAFSRNPIQALDGNGDLVQFVVIDDGMGNQREAIVVSADDGSVTVAAQQGGSTPDGGTYNGFDGWPSLVGMRGAYGAPTPGAAHINGYFHFLVCPPDPASYCTAKVNSLGCTPGMSAAGVSSATASSGFTLSAAPLINNKLAMLVYSLDGRAATPFAGGLLCVAAPFRRTPAASSAGGPPPNDCTGSHSIDMNAFAAGTLGGNPSPALRIPGRTVTAQIWSRDPGFAAPNNLSLSDGLEYVVGP